MIDDADFQTLVGATGPAVSLYFPVSQDQRDPRGPDARMRHMLEQAETALAAHGADEAMRQALLAPAREMAAGPDFAHHRDGGFVMFTAPGVSQVHTLPVPLKELVVVGDMFHVKPLLPSVARNRRFHVLALTAGETRLFSATPFSWEEVPLDILPAHAEASAIALDEAHGPSQHPEGATDRLRHDLLVASPHNIAFGVKKALGSDPAPLLLAGEPHVVGNFRPVAHLPNMLDEALLLNPFAFSHADLHARAVEVMAPLLDAELNGVLEQVRARLGTAEPTVGIRVEEILAAGEAARIASVVVAHDEALWGRFGAMAGTMVVHGHQTGAEDDLLNQVAVTALRTGGKAYAAPVGQLPRHSSAVAVYRF